jgi:hypothetical protein
MSSILIFLIFSLFESHFQPKGEPWLLVIGSQSPLLCCQPELFKKLTDGSYEILTALRYPLESEKNSSSINLTISKALN